MDELRLLSDAQGARHLERQFGDVRGPFGSKTRGGSGLEFLVQLFEVLCIAAAHPAHQRAPHKSAVAAMRSRRRFDPVHGFARQRTASRRTSSPHLLRTVRRPPDTVP